MTVPSPHFSEDPSDIQPGGLLGELERRQDDVLNQLDDLDARLSEVLKGLEPVPRVDVEGRQGFSSPPNLDVASDSATGQEFTEEANGGFQLAAEQAEQDDLGDDDSAEDWA